LDIGICRIKLLNKRFVQRPIPLRRAKTDSHW
jgi:hypothetical protein